MKFGMTNKILMAAGIAIFSLISFPVQAEEPPENHSEDPSEKCFAYLDSMPELKPLQAKIPMKVSEATFEQLANQDKVTDQEKPLIAKWAKGIKTCSDLDFAWQTRIRPSGSTVNAAVRKIIEERSSSRMSSLIDLYNQKISYGEYLKQRQEAIAKYSEEMRAANAEIDASNAKIDAANAKRGGPSWVDLLLGMAGGAADGYTKSLPPKAVTCTPNGFGGVRCQ